MNYEEKQVLNRWKSRALRAEAKLFRAGMAQFDPTQLFADDEWIFLTLEKKDGSLVTVDEVREAKNSLEARGRLLELV